MKISNRTRNEIIESILESANGSSIFIGNNDTSPHSITNGIGPNDPLSGKLFDTGVIKPKGFAEFVASNLNPGKYPYYSSNDPSLKGEIIVVSEK